MKTKEMIQTNELKFTPARLALLEIFQKSAKPLCYEDLKIVLDMDKATFYRNMTTFEEKGLINGFESSDKKRYYEIQKSVHAHFVCRVCHGIECLKNIPNFALEAHEIDNIIIHGRCPKCLLDTAH